MPVTRAGSPASIVIGLAGRRRADDGHAVLDRAAAVGRQQLGDPVGRARSEMVGSMPRSKRLDASDGSLCRRSVRKIVTGSQCAASMKMFVVVVGQLGGLAAHHAGEPDRAGVVGDQQVLGRELAVDAVEGA